MIPYSYNMVDMGGIDLAEANHTTVPGIYEKIQEAVNACGDVILYNWKFAEIEIAPSHYAILNQQAAFLINGMIQVTELDEITVLGIEPPPPPIEPVEPLTVNENGVYEAVAPASGFNPVTVNVEFPTIERCIYTKRLTKPTIDTGIPCDTESLRVVLRFNLPYYDQDKSIFAGAWANNGFLLVMYNGTLRFQSKYVYVDIPVSNVNFGLFIENVVECTKDSITVNGTTYQVAGSQENTSENLKLFSVGSSYTAEICVYALDIYIGNELIRSFTPAYNDDEACLYDSITEQYFYNTGENEIYYN